MHPPYVTPEAIREFISSAWKEDVGEGDHTTLAVISKDQQGQATLLVKDDGVLAGVEMARGIFSFADPAIVLQEFKRDGDIVMRGEVAFKVTGPMRSILTAERLVLNCMQRMSGVATYTSRLRKIIEGTKAQITDTRKTTPNFRLPEKWAVAIGGGTNHRFALYDQILIKDNHVDMAGGVKPALETARQYLSKLGKSLRVEIETRNLDEVKAVIAAGGADVIMLDNMSTAQMKEAVELVGGRWKLEASGGINEHNLRAVAETGVDFISIGALTHSVRSLDLSLKVDAPQ
ncbi:MAG: carboxylating nicotinate-nucleotide diphosphorylase [Bacteroidetes bacterium]|nr:carboxylating nicotinate-nucleotide diphosphorylase [Bacteroidota bacterium]